MSSVSVFTPFFRQNRTEKGINLSQNQADFGPKQSGRKRRKRRRRRRRRATVTCDISVMRLCLRLCVQTLMTRMRLCCYRVLASYLGARGKSYVNITICINRADLGGFGKSHHREFVNIITQFVASRPNASPPPALPRLYSSRNIMKH